jgi:hypothetical protein
MYKQGVLVNSANKICCLFSQDQSVIEEAGFNLMPQWQCIECNNQFRKNAKRENISFFYSFAKKLFLTHDRLTDNFLVWIFLSIFLLSVVFTLAVFLFSCFWPFSFLFVFILTLLCYLVFLSFSYYGPSFC